MTQTSLTTLSLTTLLERFRSSDPTPGGGSAAALAGSLGASLLVMVASLPKPRASTDEECARLNEIAGECTALARRLEALIDRDSAAYDLVVAAYRLPKTTEEEKSARAAAIQAAMKAAIATPLDVMRDCALAIAHVSTLSRLGNANASSDLLVGLELLRAGLRGARANVEINLGSVKDQAYAATVRADVDALSESGETDAPSASS
jgi:formiminotetrahydrofolate cyclodeaminase